ncbi:MAG: hypothetical protein RMJ84_00895 [Sandaracinaceae bacterium]|nr:hypothetical protein [Sandaracinaceae bacterium]
MPSFFHVIHGFFFFSTIYLASLSIAYASVPTTGIARFEQSTCAFAFSISIFLMLCGSIAGISGIASFRKFKWPSREDVQQVFPALLTILPIGIVNELWIRACLIIGAILLLPSECLSQVVFHKTNERGRGRFDLYGVGLILTAVLIGCVYIALAFDSPCRHSSDAAYYYGVAKWMANHKRLEEPIVWHFLCPPASVVHEAFDYWQGFVSFWLFLAFLVVEPNHLNGSIAMAILSSLTLILFAFALIHLPLRSRPAQLVGLLSFGFSQALHTFRVDTESPIAFQFVLILVLLLMIHQKLVLATLCSFLIVWARADGLWTLLVLLVWIHVIIWKKKNGSAYLASREHTLFFLLMVTCLIGHALFNFYRFGEITPPGSKRVLFVPYYDAIYEWGRLHIADWHSWIRRHLMWEFLEASFQAVYVAYSINDFVLNSKLLIWTLPLGYLLLLSKNSFEKSGIAILCLLLSTFVPVAIAWTGLVVFAAWRTLHGLVPAMTIAAVATWEGLIRFSARLLFPQKWKKNGESFGYFFLFFMTIGVKPYHRLECIHKDFESELALVDSIIQGKVVATNSPWWVIANTSSPAVLLPAQKEQAMVEVIERYGVSFLVLTRSNFEMFGWHFLQAWQPLRDGHLQRLGPYRIRRVYDQGAYVVVLALERETD